jgi:hypothetical protein
MIWLLSRLIVWPVKAVVGTTALGVKTTAKTAAGSAKLGYKTGKLFGYKNMVFFAFGVGLGLAIAPGPGKETRDKLKAKLVEQGLIAGGPPEVPSSLPDRAAVATNGAAGESRIDLVENDLGTSGPS